MPITKDNFIVVYNLNDDDSKDFAQYYANIHQMTYGNPSTDSASGTGWVVDGQMVGINCSNNEILDNEQQFNNEVLIPLQNALDSSPLSINRTIWGIVLGYNVPGGFKNLSDPSVYSSDLHTIISSTSRIARGCAKKNGLYHDFTGGKFKNKFYNRSIFGRFDKNDAEFSLVVSRIDAPTLSLAKEFMDNAVKVNKQLEVNGTFYVDPYADKMGKEAQQYTQLLIDFSSNTLPLLNMDTWSTMFMDPYKDVVIPFVTNDSFVWSWFTDRAYSDFFQSTNANRIFLYNADFDGAYTIRNTSVKTWPILALQAGYALSAGAMSNPAIDGFLNPTPFFIALNEGATMGEAYLFSIPYLDWTLTLFGDPLTYVSFSTETPVLNTTLNKNESWFLMNEDLSRVIAYLYEEDKQLNQMQNEIVNEQELASELALLYPGRALYMENNTDRIKDQAQELTNSLFEYIQRRYRYFGLQEAFPTSNQYLSQKEYKISRLLASIININTISSSNLLDEGWWKFDYIIQDDSFNFVDYHFKLIIYDNSRMRDDNIILIKSSNDNVENWYYETEKDIFSQMPINGVPASYIGRRLRYISEINEYLTRGTTYYFKIKQRDMTTNTDYEYREYSDIIYT